MALHGDLRVNFNKIGDWEAVRAGTTDVDGEFIYRVTVNFTDMKGYSKRRRFFVRHMFTDGALALTGKVMLESVKQMNQPERSDSHAMMDFCDMHNIDYPSWV